jgi:cyclic beta-1,2-glucan synthetase
MLNWYDIETLAPLEPRFVSTVDSGNLAACLWTLKQAALALASEPRRSVKAAMVVELAEIAEACDQIVRKMDFGFLYHPRKKVLSVGYNVTLGRLEKSNYDLLASESRIAAFVAIAKGDVPQEAWFHLGRRHTLFRGERILISWTGTMFEYLMPALWMRHHPGTITEQSMSAVVRAQRDFARRKSVPWGISESACLGEESCEHGYAAFGIPELAMKSAPAGRLVISPYSTFLALMTDPREAIKNLRRMEEFGWSGRYGFYEAVDYSGSGGGEVIRSWMAHHQGMSLLAACNLLFNNRLQRHFHSEPQVMATELLLHERLPSGVVAEPEDVLLPGLLLPDAG